MDIKFRLNKSFIISFLILLFVVSGICEDKYTADWESLKNHDTPEWFRDAKFGIYTHWGPYSVPVFGHEWYPRKMYTNEKFKRGNYYEYHTKTYGSPEKFGYKDFIPMFKAEKFNAKEWADLFKKSGAKFAGPVAEHHDGFAMWNSALTEWDAYDMGPKRDILGELKKEIVANDMKFITSFHHARKWWYFELAYAQMNKTGEKFDLLDPKYAGTYKLYPEFHKKSDPPNKAYMVAWKEKLIEVIDKYEPDLLWFDSGLKREKFWRGAEVEFEKYKQEFMAYYYNHAEKLGKKVDVTYKHHDFPKGTGTLDLERGRMEKCTEFPWLTDTSVDRNSWSYIMNPDYKSTNDLIDVLVDIVSKNGCMLLNLGPKADGTIPQEQQEALLGMGKWLEINGIAIYKTRPWIIAEEGPTKFKGGMFSEAKNSVKYTSQDIRFTRNKGGNIVYAISLAWPEKGNSITIKSINTKDGFSKDKIEKIRLLGYKKKLEWSINEEGLTFQLPKEKPCENAYCYRIKFKKEKK